MNKEELFELMEQIAGEREEARPVVEQLIASGEPPEDIEIPKEWRTAGMVLELCEGACGKNESEPRISLALSQLGLVIAKSQTRSAYDSSVHNYLIGRAWRELGIAHRFLCTYVPGSRALLQSYKAFSSHAALSYAAACALYSHAGLYFCAKNHDKAEAMTQDARAAFSDFNDRRRFAMCDALDGVIAFRRGDMNSARSYLEKALSGLEPVGDMELIGVISNNLGHVYRSLNCKVKAAEMLQSARDIAVRLNHPSEINRADWGLAIIALEGGDVVASLDEFRRIRADYGQRDMPEDAAEVGLCMLDALVALQRLGEARALAQEVLNEFAQMNLSTGTMTALAYLREVFQDSPDPHAGVRHVRKYVERARWQPSALFLPHEN